MSVVAPHLGIALSPDSQTQYVSDDGETRVVCVVSKRYTRGQQGRFWYAIRPPHVEYLENARTGFVALGCGGAGLTVLIPSKEFLQRVAGMRRTQEDGGRSYCHVELFGDSHHLELG